MDGYRFVKYAGSKKIHDYVTHRYVTAFDIMEVLKSDPRARIFCNREQMDVTSRYIRQFISQKFFDDLESYSVESLRDLLLSLPGGVPNYYGRLKVMGAKGNRMQRNKESTPYLKQGELTEKNAWSLPKLKAFYKLKEAISEMRKCLGCEIDFLSESKGNRLCEKCSKQGPSPLREASLAVG